MLISLGSNSSFVVSIRMVHSAHSDLFSSLSPISVSFDAAMLSTMGAWCAASRSPPSTSTSISPLVRGGSNGPLRSRLSLRDIGFTASPRVAGCLSSTSTRLVPSGCPALNSSAVATVARRRSSGCWPPMRGRRRRGDFSLLPDNRQLPHAPSSRLCPRSWTGMSRSLQPFVTAPKRNAWPAGSTPSSMRSLLRSSPGVSSSKSVPGSTVRPSSVSRENGLPKAGDSSSIASSVVRIRPDPESSSCASATNPMAARPGIPRTLSRVPRAHGGISPLIHST